ncbi:MAG: TRAM domain-containing protein, partial [Candidatus Thiodiazotropha sp. 6PLUC4]
FDGPADLIGQFVEVRITEALPNSLRGEWSGGLKESAVG